MRTLIVLGGDLPASRFLTALAAQADLIIAADHGLEAFRETDCLPDLILGDMDSVDPAVLASFESRVPERRLPCMKDDTDGQDALKTAMERGATDVIFLGALGGRLDHAMGNLSLLLYAAHRNIRARIMDEHVTIEAVRRQLVITGQAGETVSVIPFGNAEGVTLTGFRYPLSKYTMHSENTLGLSNVLNGNQGQIEVRYGDVIVFHHRADSLFMKPSF